MMDLIQNVKFKLVDTNVPLAVILMTYQFVIHAVIPTDQTLLNATVKEGMLIMDLIKFV